MHAERKLVRNIAKQGSRTPAHAIGQTLNQRVCRGFQSLVRLVMLTVKRQDVEMQLQGKYFVLLHVVIVEKNAKKHTVARDYTSFNRFDHN
jgi:hypothetical protein